MPPILIVPGLGGSGEHHWQTHLERTRPQAVRVHQADWDRPQQPAWTEALIAAIEAAPGAVLVAHSLGCALIAHVVCERPDLQIDAALLVAPADVDVRPCVAEPLRAFAPMPLSRLPFRSVVVASTNDPFMAINRAREIAGTWGSDFINVGRCGHINVASGFGRWSLGEEILDGLTSAQAPRHIRSTGEARPRPELL